MGGSLPEMWIYGALGEVRYPTRGCGAQVDSWLVLTLSMDSLPRCREAQGGLGLAVGGIAIGMFRH